MTPAKTRKARRACCRMAGRLGITFPDLKHYATPSWGASKAFLAVLGEFRALSRTHVLLVTRRDAGHVPGEVTLQALGHARIDPATPTTDGPREDSNGQN